MRGYIEDAYAARENVTSALWAVQDDIKSHADGDRPPSPAAYKLAVEQDLAEAQRLISRAIDRTERKAL